MLFTVSFTFDLGILPLPTSAEFVLPTYNYPANHLQSPQSEQLQHHKRPTAALPVGLELCNV